MIATIKTAEGYIEAPCSEALLWWQTAGLVPTPYKVQYLGRWRRVYCVVYSNIGTLYIGKLSPNALIVDIN